MSVRQRALPRLQRRASMTYDQPIDLIMQYAWIGFCWAGVWHFLWAMIFGGRVALQPLEQL